MDSCTDDLLTMFRNITTNDHDVLVAQFSKILQLDTNTATFFLESSNWNVEIAANNYLGTISDAGAMGGSLAYMQQQPEALLLTDLTGMQALKFPPGKVLEMHWHFQNTGPSSWPMDSRLVFTDGTTFDGPEDIRAQAESGETFSVPVRLQLPEAEGAYYGCWRLAFGMGYFGDPVWVIVNISNDAISADTKTQFDVTDNVSSSFGNSISFSGEQPYLGTTASDDMQDL